MCNRELYGAGGKECEHAITLYDLHRSHRATNPKGGSCASSGMWPNSDLLIL